MLRITVLILCALACSTAAARGAGARGGVARGPVNAEPRDQVDAYRRDDRPVAPVARYRARQDVANSAYLGAATDYSDNGGGDDGYGDNGYGNGGNDGSGNPYQGDGGTSYGTFSSANGQGSASPGAVSYTGRYKSPGNEPSACVYKAVMTDAQIATCKTASMAEMRRTGVK